MNKFDPIPIGSVVQITGPGDETMNLDWVGCLGVVRSARKGNPPSCGESEFDPFYVVENETGQVEQFWTEELKVITVCEQN